MLKRIGAFLGIALAVGCGGSIIPKDGLTPPAACVSGKQPLLPGLTPGQPVDYVELRLAAGDVVEETTGIECATASDETACKAAVAAVTSATGIETCDSGGPDVMCSQRYLVYTRGDEVGTITTLADLAAFLAPIDTPEDAVILVRLSNHTIPCLTDGTVGTRPSADGDGFDFVDVEGGGCTDTYRLLFHVAKDGTVTETAREKIASGTGMCPV